MSAELKDFWGKITPESDAVLEALNRTTGKDKSEILREVLHKWATEQIDVAMVLDGILRSQGMPGIARCASGKTRD